jgi:hypothetical protein
MPSLLQIVNYCRLFRLLRGRKPYAREVCRYFSDEHDDLPRIRRYPPITTGLTCQMSRQ